MSLDCVLWWRLETHTFDGFVAEKMIGGGGDFGFVVSRLKRKRLEKEEKRKRLEKNRVRVLKSAGRARG